MGLVSAAQENAAAVLEYAQALGRAKSIPEMMELSTSQTMQQFEMLTKQAAELAERAQNIATGAAQPRTAALGTRRE